MSANGSTADQLFHAGKLDQAEKVYATKMKQQPDNPVLQFNMGDVQYRKKDFARAKDLFSKALATDDLALQAKSYFNLGNTRFQLGQSTLKTDPEQTIEHYRKAVEAFEGCLKLRPEDKDARENLAIVKKELEKLKRQQQKKKEKKDQQKTPKKDRKSKNRKNSGQKNQQNQDHSQQPGDRKTGQKKNTDGQGNKSPKMTSSPEKNRRNDTKNRKNTAGHPPKEPQMNSKEKTSGGTDKEKSRGNDSIRARSPQAGSSTDRQMSKADASRRKQGKMTRAEAANLLDALKNEEGRLEFIPNRTGEERPPILKNW